VFQWASNWLLRKRSSLFWGVGGKLRIGGSFRNTLLFHGNTSSAKRRKSREPCPPRVRRGHQYGLEPFLPFFCFKKNVQNIPLRTVDHSMARADSKLRCPVHEISHRYGPGALFAFFHFSFLKSTKGRPFPGTCREGPGQSVRPKGGARVPAPLGGSAALLRRGRQVAPLERHERRGRRGGGGLARVAGGGVDQLGPGLGEGRDGDGAVEGAHRVGAHLRAGGEGGGPGSGWGEGGRGACQAVGIGSGYAVLICAGRDSDLLAGEPPRLGSASRAT
jgi:hypothetical protein